MQSTGELTITMTELQAIAQGYAPQVDLVKKVDADYSGRIMPDPTVIEFLASYRWNDEQGYEWTITAYYYQDQADIDAVGESDLSGLDWHAIRFEVS